MRVSIPMRAESTSNKREHWGSRASRSKRERNAAALLLKPHLGALSGPRLQVTLTRVAPHELDDDNLRGALKAFRDGVATALRVDDRSPLVLWCYAQRKGSEPGEYAVDVELGWDVSQPLFVIERGAPLPERLDTCTECGTLTLFGKGQRRGRCCNCPDLTARSG